jgi:hypothetical protein
MGGLRADRQHGARCLGIGILILSLVHTPLPEPDYHNLRHHDAPGEVCEHHDHLLRWHPGAGAAQDVAVLHWHWYLPSPAGDGSAAPTDGSALHAHVPDWQASPWDQGPSLSPGNTSQSLTRPVSSSSTPSLWTFVNTSPREVRGSGASPPIAFSATFAPQVSVAALLQRWDC